jgi:hypothetical protein
MTRLALLLALSHGAPAKPPDAALFQQVLTRHVTEEGQVQYAALKATRGPLAQFVEALSRISPDSHPALFPLREARLAYWLNAYNALVLEAMTERYPEKRRLLENPVGREAFFYRAKFTVGGRPRTLASIEDDNIRDGFRDPRIHFAIVCASKGCPRLSRIAFTAENVERELERLAREFFQEPRNCLMDPRRRVVRLSSLFKWFARDFGANDAERLAFVARYGPPEAAALRQGRWKIEYADWDWSLNDASAQPR